MVRAFLEGIEVPVLGAQITIQPNAPAQAVIQVPPAELGTRLLPRTVIHVFFLDGVEATSSLRSYRGADPARKERTPTLHDMTRLRALQGTVDQQELDREERNQKYKLLFCGEVLGFQWSKSPMQRSLVLQCLDLSNYWDYAYQFNNSDLFGPGIKALLHGAGTNLFTDFFSSPSEIVAGLLKLPSANYPALKGPMGGLIRMIESIGGCYKQDTKFIGQNVFFSIAELRLRISQMITAFPDDQTINKLLGGSSPDGIFGRSLGNLGEQVSIRTVFNAIAQMLFHETYACPAALYVPGSDGNVQGRKPATIQNLPQFKYLLLLAKQGYQFTQEYIKALEGTPAYASKADNTKEKLLMVRRAQYVGAQVAKAMQKASQDNTLRTTQNKRIRVALQDIRQRLAKVANSVQKVWFPGTKPGPKLNPVIVEINKVAVLFKALETIELDVSNFKTRTPARLQNQIVRPDVWFTAPPRCNVLFPHHITAQNYSRSFMQEPTRLLLKTHDEFFGEDELFDDYFFAPLARTMSGKRTKGKLSALFNRDIFSHELFTGIIPIFTKMGEFNILALRGQKEALKKKKDRPKISLAQRSANFLYFKSRFASRNMSVEAIFSPHLAPGFPGLVIDRYVSPEDIETYTEGVRKAGKVTPDVRKLMGTHFLGTFAAITHSLSPTQAGTSIQMQYPREYAESAEFLGPSISDDQVVIKRFGTDGVRNYTVAALDKPRLGGLGIYYGTLQSVKEISDAVEGMYFPVYVGPRRAGDPAQDGQAVVGRPVRLGDVSPKLAAEKGANEVVTFRAFQVREAIPRYRRDVVDLPAEEAIRPGWYDDVWHPAAIGKAYQHYFETGSITDATQIADPGGVSTGDPSQLARDQLVRELKGTTSTTLKEALQDYGGISPAVLSLDGDSSIEQAVDFILTTYGYIHQGNMSPQKFTDAYTWRPIASLPDIFGSSDLELDARGVDAVRGQEGFHSRAFGPHDDLFGLVTPEVTEVFGAKKTDQARREGDVRGIKHRAVLDYVEALRQMQIKGKAGG